MSKKTLTRAQRMALIEVAEQYMAGEMEDGPNPDVLTRAVHWLQDTMPHDNDNDAWVRIGSVGVDAGMLYIGDPCYIHRTPLGRSTGDKAAWAEFLRDIAPPGKDWLETTTTVMGKLPNGAPFPAGVVTTSGYGDGEYPVEVQYSNGRIARIKVDFGL